MSKINDYLNQSAKSLFEKPAKNKGGRKAAPLQVLSHRAAPLQAAPDYAFIDDEAAYDKFINSGKGWPFMNYLAKRAKKSKDPHRMQTAEILRLLQQNERQISSLENDDQKKLLFQLVNIYNADICNQRLIKTRKKAFAAAPPKNDARANLDKALDYGAMCVNSYVEVSSDKSRKDKLIIAAAQHIDGFGGRIKKIQDENAESGVPQAIISSVKGAAEEINLAESLVFEIFKPAAAKRKADEKFNKKYGGEDISLAFFKGVLNNENKTRPGDYEIFEQAIPGIADGLLVKLPQGIIGCVLNPAEAALFFTPDGINQTKDSLCKTLEDGDPAKIGQETVILGSMVLGGVKGAKSFALKVKGNKAPSYHNYDGLAAGQVLKNTDSKLMPSSAKIKELNLAMKKPPSAPLRAAPLQAAPSQAAPAGWRVVPVEQNKALKLLECLVNLFINKNKPAPVLASSGAALEAFANPPKQKPAAQQNNLFNIGRGGKKNTTPAAREAQIKAIAKTKKPKNAKPGYHSDEEIAWALILGRNQINAAKILNCSQSTISERRKYLKAELITAEKQQAFVESVKKFRKDNGIKDEKEINFDVIKKAFDGAKKGKQPAFSKEEIVSTLIDCERRRTDAAIILYGSEKGNGNISTWAKKIRNELAGLNEKEQNDFLKNVNDFRIKHKKTPTTLDAVKDAIAAKPSGYKSGAEKKSQPPTPASSQTAPLPPALSQVLPHRAAPSLAVPVFAGVLTPEGIHLALIRNLLKFPGAEQDALLLRGLDTGLIKKHISGKITEDQLANYADKLNRELSKKLGRQLKLSEIITPLEIKAACMGHQTYTAPRPLLRATAPSQAADEINPSDTPDPGRKRFPEQPKAVNNPARGVKKTAPLKPLQGHILDIDMARTLYACKGDITAAAKTLGCEPRRVQEFVDLMENKFCQNPIFKSYLKMFADDLNAQELNVRLRRGEQDPVFKKVTPKDIVSACTELARPDEAIRKNGALETLSATPEFLANTNRVDLKFIDFAENTAENTKNTKNLDAIAGNIQLPSEVREIAAARSKQLKEIGQANPPIVQTENPPQRTPSRTSSTASEYLAEQTNDPDKLNLIINNSSASVAAKGIARGKLDAIKKVEELKQQKLTAELAKKAAKTEKREQKRAEKAKALEEKRAAKKLAKAEKARLREEKRAAAELAKKSKKAEKREEKKAAKEFAKAEKAKEREQKKLSGERAKAGGRKKSVTPADLNVLEILINNKNIINITEIAGRYGLDRSNISRTIKKIKSLPKEDIEKCLPELSKKLGRKISEVSIEDINEVILAPRKRGRRFSKQKPSSLPVKKAEKVNERTAETKFKYNDRIYRETIEALLKTDGHQKKAAGILTPKKTKSSSFAVTINLRAKKIRNLPQKDLEKYAKDFKTTVNRIKAVCGDKDAINIEALNALREANGNAAKAKRTLKLKGSSPVFNNLSAIKNSPEKCKKYSEILGITVEEFKNFFIR